jgi:glucokinase
MSEQKHIALAEAQPPFFVGIDLGGTYVKVGVIDDLGRTLYFGSEPTLVPEGPEAGARRMGAAVRKAIAGAGLKPEQVAGVGLGSPGTMDVPGGRLVDPANLDGWQDFPIRDRVAFHAGFPIAFANDARAAAFGELWLGYGRGRSDLHSLIVLTLGTGIGCGIILNGRVHDGEHSHGGEFGHSIINFHDDARQCGCGKLGHFEAYASATAVTRRAQEALDAGRPSSLRGRLGPGVVLEAKLVAEEAEKGDELSGELVLQTARYLAVGIVTLMHTLDPQAILIGGAATFGGHGSPVGSRFLAEVRAEVGRRAYRYLVERTEIDFALLGSEAGYIGAAAIARAAGRR